MKIIKPLSYDDYVKMQQDGNIRKLKKYPDVHCVKIAEILAIVNYIKENIPNPTFGICHGVRNGWEVEQLSLNLPGVQIIGTDISITASKYKNVIQHDFHFVKPEWINATDFIFSNSLDHSYDPRHAIDQWMSCIKSTGRLFITWYYGHGEEFLKESCGDIFGASVDEYRILFNEKYFVSCEMNIKTEVGRRRIFVVQHRV